MSQEGDTVYCIITSHPELEKVNSDDSAELIIYIFFAKKKSIFRQTLALKLNMQIRNEVDVQT